MNFPPIFVISLARAKERREKMRAQLDKLGVHYEVVDAVDGATLNPADYEHRLRRDKFRRRHEYEILDGEIGCYLSHYRLWERMVAEEIPRALVLEDDAELSEDFSPVIADVLTLNCSWDVVHLAVRRPELVDVACRGLAGRDYVFGRYKRRLLCAHAYLIGLAGARKLLDICREISEPIDDAWGHWWQTGLMFYCVSPELAKQVGAESTIGYNNRTSTRKLADRITSSIWRRKERIVRCLYRWMNPVPKITRDVNNAN